MAGGQGYRTNSQKSVLDFPSFGLLGSEDALSGETTYGSSPPSERDVQTRFHCCSIQVSAGLGQLFLPVTVGSWPGSSAGIRGGQCAGDTERRGDSQAEAAGQSQSGPHTPHLSPFIC